LLALSSSDPYLSHSLTNKYTSSQLKTPQKQAPVKGKPKGKGGLTVAPPPAAKHVPRSFDTFDDLSDDVYVPMAAAVAPSSSASAGQCDIMGADQERRDRSCILPASTSRRSLSRRDLFPAPGGHPLLSSFLQEALCCRDADCLRERPLPNFRSMLRFESVEEYRRRPPEFRGTCIFIRLPGSGHPSRGPPSQSPAPAQAPPSLIGPLSLPHPAPRS
jgi:hypothetical protein